MSWPLDLCDDVEDENRRIDCGVHAAKSVFNHILRASVVFCTENISSLPLLVFSRLYAEHGFTLFNANRQYDGRFLICKVGTPQPAYIYDFGFLWYSKTLLIMVLPLGNIG